MPRADDTPTTGPPTPPHDVTDLLLAWNEGDGEALDRLMPLVYQDLRRLAASKMRGERPGHTLQATALVHQAYLRLVDQRRVQWKNRAHFFAVAATLMRRILVSHAREHGAAKRGGSAVVLGLDEALGVPGQERDVDLVALDESLERLAAMSPRQSRIVELRFFGGLTIEETAEVVEISPATVKLDWQMARAWLYRRLRGDAGATGAPAR